MNGWSGSKEIEERLQKEWNKGRFLAAHLTGETIFPLRLPLRQPASGDLGDRYAEVREWIERLVRHAKPNTGKGYELEWREVNHRQLGSNRLPSAAIFREEADALRFIRKEKEAESFRALSETILAAFPLLKPFLARAPLRTLEHAPDWPRLLAVLKWLLNHPRPNLYIRQIEIPEVDTKFIGERKKLLCELLDIVLPPAAIDESAKGAAGFEQRFGFRSKPAQVRFRLLDPALYIQGLSDLQVPAGDFSRLDPNVRQVFITENDINGLAFPDIETAMVIFGLGYGLDRLSAAGWLHGKKIYYWGDIDTHGFAMLDRIRHHFPQTCSFLMDRVTLMDHRSLWGREEAPTNRALTRLSAAEAALYEDLVHNRLAEALRLEQERISFTHLKSTLKALQKVKEQRSEVRGQFSTTDN